MYSLCLVCILADRFNRFRERKRIPHRYVGARTISKFFALKWLVQFCKDDSFAFKAL